jgi:hypothetical protein
VGISEKGFILNRIFNQRRVASWWSDNYTNRQSVCINKIF